MPTQLEANAGIEFNFNVLTYARSKNNTTIKSFYFKINLFHQYYLLSYAKRVVGSHKPLSDMGIAANPFSSNPDFL